MSIFIASYFLWDPLKVEILDLKVSNLKSNNVILFYLSILFIIICILFGHKGQLEIGAYGDGNFTSTILNEYIIIFFLIAYIYSSNVKFRKYLIFISFFIYIIINFIYGDRIGVLQTSILIFILYFNNKFNYKKIVLLAIFTIMIFNAVSVFRSTGKIILKNKNEEKQVTVIDTNQSQVFNSSVSIVRLLDDNVISSYDRIESLGKYALRIVIPSENMLLSNLSKYSTIIYASQGGGFIASYFYIWFGYLGVILVGIIVCKLFSLISKDIKNNSIVALIIFISIFPRWLVYDPLIGLKMPIYTIIIYNCFIFLNYFIKKFSI
ncbi:hypothetical protein P5E74_09280 [Clostridium perfringens]|nr:hypothetical protein [Clostridium perfringens]